jgi:hypothetical protein
VNDAPFSTPHNREEIEKKRITRPRGMQQRVARPFGKDWEELGEGGEKRGRGG